MSQTLIHPALSNEGSTTSSRRSVLAGALGVSALAALGTGAASSASAADASVNPGDGPYRGTKGERTYHYAVSKYGARYVWGSQGPNTFDCAGLIRWAYHNATGVWLPVGTYQQFNCRQIVRRAGTFSLASVGGHAAFGDPVFFWNGSSIGHVGLYAGYGNVLSATTSSGVVVKPATAFAGNYRCVYTGWWR